VALDFDPDAPLLPPVAATVEPSTELDDDQVVTVRGEHLSFREEAFAFVCAEGDGPVGARCDLDRLVRAVPDQEGAATTDLQVRATFSPPLGGSVDCRAAGTACHVQVSWSFDPPPDRQTDVPISFRSLVPPTTEPATTTTTSPPGTPTPPAPAAPVDARPVYTG
jgi:hypothetical protein